MDRSFKEQTYETDQQDADHRGHVSDRRATPDRRKKDQRVNADRRNQPILTQAEINALLHG